MRNSSLFFLSSSILSDTSLGFQCGIQHEHPRSLKTICHMQTNKNTKYTIVNTKNRSCTILTLTVAVLEMIIVVTIKFLLLPQFVAVILCNQPTELLQQHPRKQKN